MTESNGSEPTLTLWQRILRLLRDNIWQSVSVAVAVIALVATLAWPKSSGGHNEPRSSTSVGVGQAGCVQVNGAGNSCTVVAPSTAPPSQASLAIDSQWPNSPSCGVADIAVLPGGANPAAGVPGLSSLVAPYGFGFLTLTFTATDDSTIQIEGIKPKFYRVNPLIPADWVYESGGCGDTYTRVFALDLDHRTFTDRGIEGDPAQGTGQPPPDAPLGPTFHVSKDDPATIEIQVSGCQYNYEWGVEVTFTVGGKRYVEQFGTPAAPYRTIGVDRSANPQVYTSYTDTGPLVHTLGSPSSMCNPGSQ